MLISVHMGQGQNCPDIMTPNTYQFYLFYCNEGGAAEEFESLGSGAFSCKMRTDITHWSKLKGWEAIWFDDLDRYNMFWHWDS